MKKAISEQNTYYIKYIKYTIYIYTVYKIPHFQKKVFIKKLSKIYTKSLIISISGGTEICRDIDTYFFMF